MSITSSVRQLRITVGEARDHSAYGDAVIDAVALKLADEAVACDTRDDPAASATSLDPVIARIVANAPRLSDAQRERLAVVLGSAQRSAVGTSSDERVEAAR